MQVAEEWHLDSTVAFKAISYLDRYLSLVNVDELRRLAVVSVMQLAPVTSSTSTTHFQGTAQVSAGWHRLHTLCHARCPAPQAVQGLQELSEP